MAEADTEARKMRRALAMDCEVELRSSKQAVTDLDGQVRQLEADLKEREENRLELQSQVKNLKAWTAAYEKARRQTFNPESAVIEAKAKVDVLEKKLASSLGELDKTGRIASNAAGALAEAREEAASWLQKHGEIAKELENLQLERDGLQKNIALINGRAEKAAQVSAAKISTLEGELSASRGQVAAILAGVASIRNPGKE